MSNSEYKPMSFESSEKESFIPSISSILAKRRRIGEKFPLLGWITSLILALIILYGKIYPPKPTDLQCDRQLNAWCEYLYPYGISERDAIAFQERMKNEGKPSFQKKNEEWRKTQTQTNITPAPLEDIITYEDVQFQNEFWQESPYRGKPTPALEKAWKDLWYIGAIDVPFAALPLLNKSTEIKWERSSKGGVLGGLEVHHSLHCLDMVRQYTWRGEYDFSDNPTFQDDDAFIREVSFLFLFSTATKKRRIPKPSKKQIKQTHKKETRKTS